MGSLEWDWVVGQFCRVLDHRTNKDPSVFLSFG